MNEEYFYCLPRREMVSYPGMLRDVVKGLFSPRMYCRGEYVDVFERKFADYIGVKYALSVGSGRIGLAIILKALKLRNEDEIILSAYNFPQLVVLVESLGLRPVLVDIDRMTLSIDVQELKKKITNKTRVVVVTHFFGQAADIGEISRITREYGIFLVEDCAHSLGAEYKSRKVGSIGDAGFFSFSLAKNINTFFGGIVTTNDRNLFDSMKKESIKQEMFSERILKKEVLKGVIAKILLDRRVYLFTAFPFILLGNLLSPEFDVLRVRRALRFKKGEVSNQYWRFTDFQAFVGLKQMELLNTINSRRVEKVKFLKSLLKPSIQTQIVISHTMPVYSFFLLITQSNRRRVIRKLICRKIDTDIEFMKNCAFLIKSDERYYSSEWVERNSFLIRLSHSISPRGVRYIADTLNCIL